MQALLPFSKSDDAERRIAKEEYVDGVLAAILAGADFSEAVAIEGLFPLAAETLAGGSSVTYPVCSLGLFQT